MFGHSLKLPIGTRLDSYADALRRYNDIKPIRGRQDQNTRPFGDRRNDNLTIRTTTTQEVVIRLYDTDIIRFSPDNTLHLETYSSVLTNRVVNHILWTHPARIQTQWGDRANATKVGEQWFNTPNVAEISPDGRLVWGSEPFRVTRVDRPLAKEVLKASRYNEFRVWFLTMLRLGIDKRQGRWWQRPTDREVVDYLAKGPDGWTEILELLPRGHEPSTTLDLVRTKLYDYHQCYTTVEIPFCSSWKELRAVLQ